MRFLESGQYVGSDDGVEACAEVSPHRCELMLYSLEDERFLVDYLPETREYVVWRLKDPRRPGGTVYKPFQFCPWCGERLPASLDWRRTTELLDLAGIDEDDLDDIFELIEKAPPAYHTDKWWRGKYDESGERVG